MLYSATLFLLISLIAAARIQTGQVVWIEHGYAPGGPAEYMEDQNSTWFIVLATAADITASFMGDALLASIKAIISS